MSEAPRVTRPAAPNRPVLRHADTGRGSAPGELLPRNPPAVAVAEAAAVVLAVVLAVTAVLSPQILVAPDLRKRKPARFCWDPS